LRSAPLSPAMMAMASIPTFYPLAHSSSICIYRRYAFLFVSAASRDDCLTRYEVSMSPINYYFIITCFLSARSLVATRYSNNNINTTKYCTTYALCTMYYALLECCVYDHVQHHHSVLALGIPLLFCGAQSETHPKFCHRYIAGPRTTRRRGRLGGLTGCLLLERTLYIVVCPNACTHPTSPSYLLAMAGSKTCSSRRHRASSVNLVWCFSLSLSLCPSLSLSLSLSVSLRSSTRPSARLPLSSHHNRVQRCNTHGQSWAFRSRTPNNANYYSVNDRVPCIVSAFARRGKSDVMRCHACSCAERRP
jgi:hypothetical protein